MFHSACHESPRSTFHRFCASHLWIVLLTFSHKTSVTGIHYFILFYFLLWLLNVLWMSSKLLLEYILEPELILFASELLIAERPLRRRRMKSGTFSPFSSLVKERNKSLKRHTITVETATNHCSSLPIRSEVTITDMQTLAKIDRTNYYKRIQINGSKPDYRIGLSRIRPYTVIRGRNDGSLWDATG